MGRKVGTDYTCLTGLLEFQKQYCQRVVVHTHGNLSRCKPPLLILTTRNPFDYAVSSYFFHYRNRHSKRNTSVEAALPAIMTRYCRTYHAQLAAAERSDKTIAITYEHLVANPFEVLAYCIEELFGAVETDALTEAIQMASVDRLKSYESERGEAVVAREGTFAGEHFVRSGKVGEGAEFFSDDQRAIIYNYLTKCDVPMDGAL